MSETLGALLFIFIGMVFIFSKQTNEEKYKMRINGNPIDIIIR